MPSRWATACKEGTQLIEQLVFAKEPLGNKAPFESNPCE